MKIRRVLRLIRVNLRLIILTLWLGAATYAVVSGRVELAALIDKINIDSLLALVLSAAV